MFLDNDVPNAVLGCDPGPTHCAFALVTRSGNSLTLASVDYVPLARLVDAAVGAWRISCVSGWTRPFAFAFEKVTTRYGSVPGATTFDTCRNSGVALVAAVAFGAKESYGLATTDWRVALGGSPRMKDSEVRRELIELFGEEADKYVARRAREMKESLCIKESPACHIRDAVGVAVGTYLMKRRGVAAADRIVWRAAGCQATTI